MSTAQQHIFHPTDLSVASRSAFHHALRIALALRAKLTVMHVDAGEEADWEDLPGVRHTLAHWGLLPEEGADELLQELGLGVRKVIARGNDTVRTCLDYLERHPAELIVLATGKHQGRMAWLDQRVSEPMARDAWTPTLFIPHDSHGFVDAESGAIGLKRVLIPVAKDPHPGRAMERLTDLANALGVTAMEATLLHVGHQGTMPAVVRKERHGVTWLEQITDGGVVDGILDQVDEISPDLITMTTKGHDGFLDALRGDTTERVLRLAGRPVLAIPA